MLRYVLFSFLENPRISASKWGLRKKSVQKGGSLKLPPPIFFRLSRYTIRKSNETFCAKVALVGPPRFDRFYILCNVRQQLFPVSSFCLEELAAEIHSHFEI